MITEADLKKFAPKARKEYVDALLGGLGELRAAWSNAVHSRELTKKFLCGAVLGSGRYGCQVPECAAGNVFDRHGAKIAHGATQ